MPGGSSGLAASPLGRRVGNPVTAIAIIMYATFALLMVAIPQGYETLLERPLYGHLATTRPGGNAQVNPMWFDWDGELLRFTHTTKRQKYRNVTANPNVAMSISDPDNPYRYLEVRGVVEEIVPDPTGAFYLHLNDRYSGPLTEPPPDKADRVILVVRPTGYSKQ